MITKRNIASLVAGIPVGIFLAGTIALASTTISTSITTGGGLSVSGTTVLGTYVTVPGGNGIDVASSGTLNIGTSTATTITIGRTGQTVTFPGTASTSALRVGDEAAAPAINGMVMGYCSFSDVTLAASSTDGFASCTATPAGSLVAGDRVFVQATSSFESPYVITAASTTDASTIQLRILNTGLGTADGTLSGTSVNFWAIR